MEFHYAHWEQFPWCFSVAYKTTLFISYYHYDLQTIQHCGDIAFLQDKFITLYLTLLGHTYTYTHKQRQIHTLNTQHRYTQYTHTHNPMHTLTIHPPTHNTIHTHNTPTHNTQCTHKPTHRTTIVQVPHTSPFGTDLIL